MESSVEAAMELALESSVEPAMESALESAMATTGEHRLAQPPPEVVWQHWDQVSGAGACHVLVVVPPGPGIRLPPRVPPSDGLL